MSDGRSTTALDRLWSRLEERYGADEVGCDCLPAGERVAVLEGGGLTRRDLADYRNGDARIAELVAKLDVDVDPEHVDDLDDLVDALEDADEIQGSADASGRP